MKYKVVLVEDQYVARQLFGLYLKDSEKYEIVRTLESASGIAEILRNVPVDLPRPGKVRCDPDGYPSG